jgi:hypothetical protein
MHRSEEEQIKLIDGVLRRTVPEWRFLEMAAHLEQRAIRERDLEALRCIRAYLRHKRAQPPMEPEINDPTFNGS